VLDQRLAAIADKLAELRAGDRGFAVFGSWGHEYRLEPPVAEADLVSFEAEHEIQLPADYRAFLGAVANGGAGPGFGLGALAAPRDGWLHLAHSGCGHYSVLWLAGDAFGQVWTTDGDHHLAPMADSFLDWYEAWLDRSVLDWAHAQMVEDLRGGARRDPRLLELTAEGVGGANHAAELERAGYRALYIGHTDGARGLFERAAAAHPAAREGRPPAAFYRAMCDLYRVTGEVEARLAAAEAGARGGFWGPRKALLWEMADALFALGREDAAIAALVERVRCRDLDAVAEAVSALRRHGRAADAEPLIDEACERRRGVWVRRTAADVRAEIERLALSYARSTS
jgi:hypothetical protein